MICTQKAKRAEENLGFRSSMAYWQQQTDRSLRLDMQTLH